MITATIILGILSILLLSVLIVRSLELRAVSCQLSSISHKDSNELVHTVGNAAPNELINQINGLLLELRENEVAYRKKSHALTQMMTNLSHDLRTPLTSAMGYLNMIFDSDLPNDEKEKELRIVLAQLKRLEELINSFFEFSKMISGDVPLKLSPVNLAEVLQESIAHYYDDFNGQNRRINFICYEAKILMQSNYTMLLRIFDNLIGNAYKHGTGTLTVRVSKEETLCIYFENPAADGEVDVAHIFDEFYTTDISRTKGSTGLGLAIAKQFTQILGGRIYATCEKDLFSVIVEFGSK